MCNVSLSMAGALIADAGLIALGYAMSLVFKPAFYILNTYLVCRFSLSKFDSLPVAATAVFSAIAVLLVAVTVIFNLRSSFETETVLNMTVNVISYVTVVLLYAFIYITCVYHEKETEMSSEAQKAEARCEELDLEARSIDAMRKVRHDIKNQYTYMDMLIKEQRFDDLAAYFDGMKEDFGESLLYIDTGNREINTVLNMEQGKAKRKGSSIKYDIAVPKKLGINEKDLSTMLINLIDNAIEANERYGAEEIMVGMKTNNDFLHVQVANRLPEGTDGEKVLSMASSKKQKGYHGIGHRTVKKICEEYGGSCDFSVKDGVFFADAVIQTEASET